MFQKIWISALLLLIGAAAFLVRPVSAGPQPQVVYQTPTAQPDGRIIYVVQPGDTCMRIQLLTNNATTVEELRTLNKLDQNCTLSEGREILLDIITPQPSPTPNPLISPTPPLPTPTLFTGSGSICVMLYNDLNGNAVREVTELPMEGGAVSITDRLGSISKTGSTLPTAEMLCNEVPEGNYTVSMAIPGGFNATTSMNLPLRLEAGDSAILEFGAQVSTQAQLQEPAAGEPEAAAPREPLIAVLGGVLVLAGIGLGVYIFFQRR